MGSIVAKDLRASLAKASDLGLVEETFDLCGQTLTVRNLRPPEVENCIASCMNKEDYQYLNLFQRMHVCFGLVELNGFSFRDIQFVDDEEPDPKRAGATRKVKLEKHQWLADNLVSDWGQEAIFTIYRKIGDCTARAEKLAREGVTFLAPDETDEDKYRRLLGEIKEIEQNMPAQLIERTLEEFGYVQQSTLDELRAAEDKLEKLRVEEEAKTAGTPPEPEPVPEPSVAQAKDLLRARVPMNQQPLMAGPPPATSVPATSAPVVSSRAAALAALEAEADVTGMMADAVAPQNLPRPTEIAEIGGPQPKIDLEKSAREASAIIERPPVGGINPKFRPPSRG